MDFTYETGIYEVKNSIDELEALIKELTIKYEGVEIPEPITIYFQMTSDFNWENFTAIFPPLPKGFCCCIEADNTCEDKVWLKSMSFTGGSYKISDVNARRVYLTETASVQVIKKSSFLYVSCHHNSNFRDRWNSSYVIKLFDRSEGIISNSTEYVEVWDNASVECSNCDSVTLRDNARGDSYRSNVSLCSNNATLLSKHSSITVYGTSALIYDYHSKIYAREGFNFNKIMPHNTELFYNNCYKDSDCNGMYKDPRLYITSNRIYYKAVYKRNGVYFSKYSHPFTYKIGETVYPDSFNDNPEVQCAAGIHIASAEWAVNYGLSFNIDNDTKMAILEVEVPEDAEIVVPYMSEGKLRASKVKVLREVPIEELGAIGLFFKNFYRVGDDANA